jgi:hypothetical protein
MNTESTIFSETTESTAPATSPSVSLPQEVQDLVGQGKKYATAEDALRSVPHAQTHIKTLEGELQAARDELAKRRTAEELLDEIKSGMKAPETPSGNPITSDTVAQLVEQQLARQAAQQTAAQNARQVVDAIKSSYGDKAEEFYVSLANDSGLSVDALNRLAATSPAAVLRLAGLTTKTQTPPVGRLNSSVNTDHMRDTTQDVSNLSARVGSGATTKKMVDAWKIAGLKIGKQS